MTRENKIPQQIVAPMMKRHISAIAVATSRRSLLGLVSSATFVTGNFGLNLLLSITSPLVVQTSASLRVDNPIPDTQTDHSLQKT
jgi:hypothetical protein